MEQTIQKYVHRPDGGRLVLEQHGGVQGPAIVILPGVMSDALAWSRVARALTAWPRAVVVNRRGRAPSSDLPTDYSLGTEIGDLLAVLEEVDDVAAVLGWSYGGLIALSAASIHPMSHVIAYEPVAPPFGQSAVGALRAAGDAGDRDAIVQIVLRDIAGIPEPAVSELRAHDGAWAAMRAVAAPVPAETIALGAADLSGGLARRAGAVDLVLGGANRDRAPYGTSFEDVRAAVPDARVHELHGAGHLAHLEGPEDLAALVDSLART